MNLLTQLPLPPHFDRRHVDGVWRVPYQARATEAKTWVKQHGIPPAGSDRHRVGLLLIDVQNTFCIPEFELFVGGRSGLGAVEDNIRLCEFIYRNLAAISEIAVTMDTHMATQIFHPVFWINDAGEHPAAMTMISLSDVETGVWKVNPAILNYIAGGNLNRLQNYALHYVRQLQQNEKYLLTIWPYHSMLGGIGHAIVSAVEEACFFHAMARDSQTYFELKGNHPLTENYSVLKPEVTHDHEQEAIGETNHAFLQKLLRYDALIVAGQAKSHCVAWTIEDLLSEIEAIDPALAQKVYLLEDCSSPVVVPNVIDFTDAADATYQRFANAGMHRVQSTEAIESWLKL
ncbi:isochorismatase [Leptolyngbya sp. FACHB-711]|uniref:isochorismatase n=1 Tax=unclassified Leptolyngbya TaxID=2650499 RepID=UPI00168A237A|nr:isochorismatase [Leptolyngbya sp. FACHB-711]MBD1853560.1 isochorismatase [Cyanobacteria bacterium FACHB-502]MBD2028080.1 isochorismatase [Leptolyngbya sp. FACHB-711]